MRAYVIKRLLVMIPTFFGITLIVFAVLNFAPGKPGAMQQGQDATASDLRAADTQESQRIFREQFNLDKPVVLNTYFALERREVESTLRVLAGIDEAPASLRIAAQEKIEAWGRYVVPQLVEVLQVASDSGDDALRDTALRALRLAARRRLLHPFHPDPSPELRAQNREITLENARMRNRVYQPGDSETRKREVVAEWVAWYQEHRGRWTWDGVDKLRILILETRLASYISNLLRLDFGVSLVSREPVIDTLISKIPYSLSLSIGSLFLAYLISIPLGIFSAVYKDTRSDRVATVALFMLYSLPSFFVATILLYFFSNASDFESLRLFPTGGWRSRNFMDLTTLEQVGDIAWHLCLPLVCMTYGSLAALSRYMRTGLLDVIAADYVRTARAKGLSEWRVIGKHALRNGLLPILTLLAGLLPAVLGGSVIIEYIFGIPGMGQWMITSIYQRDYNAIMVVQLFSTLLVLVGILLTDLSYALVDPRIRYE